MTTIRLQKYKCMYIVIFIEKVGERMVFHARTGSCSLTLYLVEVLSWYADDRSKLKEVDMFRLTHLVYLTHSDFSSLRVVFESEGLRVYSI